MNKKTTGVPEVISGLERIGPRLREGAFIGFAAVFLFLLLAMLSYSPLDGGWSRTSSSSNTHNSAGPAGAWFADVSFSLFGYMAYLIPFLLAYRAWILFRERYEPEPFDWVTIGLRVMGLAMVMVASTSLAAISDPQQASLPFGAGGLLGATVAKACVQNFSILGSRLLLVALFLFGMTIFTDLSWLRLMDKLGAYAVEGSGKFVDFMQTLRDRAKDRAVEKRVQQTQEAVHEQRKVVVEKKLDKAKARKPPEIKPMPKQAPSLREEREKQRVLFDAPVTGVMPPLELLDMAVHEGKRGYSKETLEGLSRLLEIKLLDFGVVAEVVAVYPGPVITRFEIQPAAGVKVSKISNLAKDLARSLAVISVRVVEVIPGKSVVGIEIPNEDREVVNFREVLASDVYGNAKSPLTMALGHDIAGEPVCADLGKMPHLLVAGTTGSGKSVGVNAMLMSLLYKSTPAEVRLIMVDPKMLELSVYEGIPHLLTPVITDMKDAANGLRWCVGEMERRYKLMAALGVRNLAGYNKKVTDAISEGEPIPDPIWTPSEDELLFEPDKEHIPPGLESLPSIVVVIDEFADMMMIVGKKVEELIARIAQKARAAGIHLILATQRPSVDVITGLIKANVPTRIAFQVSSRIDSRTILDQGGAEQLLGHGDMLYLPAGSGLPVRVHGAFVSDEEVHRVVADWRKRGEPAYIEGLLEEGSTTPVIAGVKENGDDNGEGDALYDEAVAFVTETRRASISSVQRKLRIGYNRAARLVETMEAAGVVTEMGTNGAREVLAPAPIKN